MIIGIGFLEVLFAIFFILVFNLKLGKNSNNIELLILENNKEIQNSFNSVLSLQLSLAK
jgi:hypothetical protein